MRLRLKSGDTVHLRGVSGSLYTGIVLLDEGATLSVVLMPSGCSEHSQPGLVRLKWDGETYRSQPNNKPVQVDLPVRVPATLKKLKTDDGILELQEETCYIGKKYMLDLMSIHDRDWGHFAHPGKFWKRQTALVFCNQDESDMAQMPVELFDFETHA